MSKFCHLCGEFYMNPCLKDIHLKYEIRALKKDIEDTKDRLEDLKNELIKKEYKLEKIETERINDGWEKK